MKYRNISKIILKFKFQSVMKDLKISMYLMIIKEFKRNF